MAATAQVKPREEKVMYVPARSLAHAFALALPAMGLGCAAPSVQLDATVKIKSESASNLTLVTERLDAELFPAISPDGTRLYFQSAQVHNSGGAAPEEPSSSTSLVSRLGLGRSGQNVEQTVLDWEIGSKGLDGTGGYVRITNFDGYDGQPCPHPDGESVVFVSDRLSGQGLWSTRIDGSGGARQIRALSGRIDRPTLAPNGRKIMFAHAPGDAWRESYIWTCNFDGSELTQLVSGRYPDWSRDGKRVVFVRYAPLGDRSDLWLMGADATSLTQLTSHPAGIYCGYPSFSADGEWIAFSLSRGGPSGYDLYLLRADGTSLTQLTSSAGDEIAPAWAADGHLYFSAETREATGARNWNIWRLRPRA